MKKEWWKLLFAIAGISILSVGLNTTVNAEDFEEQEYSILSDQDLTLSSEQIDADSADEVEKNDEEKDEKNEEKKDTEEITTGWKQENGSWYYLDEEGNVKTGWLLLNEEWYYLDPVMDGKMVEGNWKYINDKWYHFYDSGVMEQGWTYYRGAWYHLSESGAMDLGWSMINGSWYYFDPATDGKMVEGSWKYINNKWYHFYDSGVMEQGWTYYRGAWYHLSESGAMDLGWSMINGSWYYFDPLKDGQMLSGRWSYINGNWYHLGSSGAMETGWIELNGDWYYLYPAENSAGAPEGAMASGTTIDGYVVSQDGIYNEAYQGAYKVLNQVGWGLWSAYNWSAKLPYVNYSNNPSPGSKNFAIHGFQTNTGDCYVMAGTFYYMAKLLGYDAHQMAGYVPLRGGKMGVHSWVEIDMDGSTYIFDPDFTNETGRNGYHISYGMSGTWQYSNYYRMN